MSLLKLRRGVAIPIGNYENLVELAQKTKMFKNFQPEGDYSEQNVPVGTKRKFISSNLPNPRKCVYLKYINLYILF